MDAGELGAARWTRYRELLTQVRENWKGRYESSNRKIEISPSVLGADLMRLGEEIRMVEALGIHWLHLDNMDGHFAPNISFGPDFVRAIRGQTKLLLDTHLMLSEPMKYIEAYARAGADLITVHAEADDNCAEVLEAIHALGVKAGVSIKSGNVRLKRLNRCCRCATSCW